MNADATAVGAASVDKFSPPGFAPDTVFAPWLGETAVQAPDLPATLRFPLPHDFPCINRGS